MGSNTLSKTTIARAVSFVSRQRRAVKSLAGFRKHHHLPGGDEASRMRFVAEIAREDVDRDLADVFSGLRSAFGFRRKQMTVSGPIDGSGSIVTPAFVYQIDLLPDGNRQDSVCWQRRIRAISDYERIFSAEFDQVFGNAFDTLQLGLPEALDVEAIIDHIEESAGSGVSVDYDKDATWCKIHVPESMTTMKIAANRLSVTGSSEMSPEKLLQGFWQIQNRFLATLQL